MKYLKYITVSVFLSASISSVNAQQLPLIGDLLGGAGSLPSPNTLPVELLGLASPLLQVLGTGAATLEGVLPTTGTELAALNTLLTLPDSGAGALGVLVPLGSGVLLGGGVDGVLRLTDGLPIPVDLPVSDILLGLTPSLGFGVL